MHSILVVYGSHEGQTAKVAKSIGTSLRAAGYTVTINDLTDETDMKVEGFDAVIVGSPVNNRKHLPEVLRFVKANRDALSARPTAFFQLSLASILPLRWAKEGAREFVDSLIEETEWQPDQIGYFAGAVKYTKYDPRTRLLFKLVSTVLTGDTDTSRDYEYTDWEQVDAFAADFASLVDRRLSLQSDADPIASTRSLDYRIAVVLTLVALAILYWLLGPREFLDDSDGVPDSVQ